MPECPELQTILESDDDAALRRHVESCPICQTQLERLAWAPSTVRAVGRSTDDPDEHPTQLQLATFVENGYADPNANEIIQHLSHCRTCRETVTAAWGAVVEHSRDETPPDVPRSPSPRSSLTRVACGLAALLAFAGECVLLAFAVAQFVLAWVIEPVGFGAVPVVWPLTAVPGPAARFWLLLGFCLVGAFILRWAAGHLFRCAMTRACHSGGAP